MPADDALPVLPFASDAEWEAWLEAHHADADGVWIRMAKKSTGIPSVHYPEVLDTALCVLGGPAGVAYLPSAFSPGSQAVLRQLFPDAVLASIEDAEVLGLNAVSDGRRVVLPVQAQRLTARLIERGYEPFGVDLSELLKAGGGPKCCTLEVRDK